MHFLWLPGGLAPPCCVISNQRSRGSKNRPWTLIQTGPPELPPVYATTTANLLMHSESDVMLVQELNS